MNLYIDKDNLISIIKQNKHPLYPHVINTIKRQLKVFFNFSKKSIESDEFILHFFNNLTEGYGDGKNPIFLEDSVFPPRPVLSECIETFNAETLSGVYLINDSNVDRFKELGAVLVSKVGDEMETFNSLFLKRNDYDFTKSLKIGGREFKKWGDLKKYNLPLTDIVFIDRFILNDKSNLESNLISYLKVLCEHSNSCVNIVFYVEKKKVGTNLLEVMNSIKSAIASVTSKSPNVTIIEYTAQRDMDSLEEHDRTIFTNYLRIYSGDTFNYWYSTSLKKTKGRNLIYFSLAKKEEHDLVRDLISDLQENINFLKANKTGIHGDRKSNYLNFN